MVGSSSVQFHIASSFLFRFLGLAKPSPVAIIPASDRICKVRRGHPNPIYFFCKRILRGLCLSSDRIFVSGSGFSLNNGAHIVTNVLGIISSAIRSQEEI